MTKIFIIFLFLLSILIKEELSFEVLSKYGKTKTHDSSIFLDVSDFELDDKIYISITTYQMHSLDQKLYYNFYDSTDMSDDYYTAPNYVYSGSQTKVSSFNSFEETYNYLYPPVTIENTKGDNSIVLIIVVIAHSSSFCSNYHCRHLSLQKMQKSSSYEKYSISYGTWIWYIFLCITTRTSTSSTWFTTDYANPDKCQCET